jgi:nitrate reductase delta subunit
MIKLKTAAEQKIVYSTFAALLKYPDEDIEGLTEECINALLGQPSYPEETVEELSKFQQKISDMPLDDLQGIYSCTFEFSADQTLDLSHHLYDGFKRSNSLVHIKEMYRAHGFPFDAVAKGELPDNLPLVLQFLATVKDEKTRKEFREGFLIKALEKLDKNFENIEDNIYRPVISALVMVVDKDVKET